MQKNVSFKVIILFSVFIALVSCTKKEQASFAMPAPLVEVMNVERVNYPVTFSYVGEVVGSDAVNVMAQASGVITKRLYKEGSYVSEGQSLFQIEPSTYIATLEKAKGLLAQSEATLVNAKLDFERKSNLYKTGAISQADYDNSQTSYKAAIANNESAKADVKSAQIMLSYTNVVSPVSGYSGMAVFNVGNLVNTGSGLTTVTQTNPVDVEYSVSENDFASMRDLAERKILVTENPYAELRDAYGMKMLDKGEILFIEKTVNSFTGAIKSKARFKNDNMSLLPGQYVTLDIKGSYLKNSILVPQKALIQTQNGSMVVVVDNNSNAVYRPIVLSKNFGQKYLIESGLENGERIIVEGTNKAQPGKPVRIKETQAAK